MVITEHTNWNEVSSWWQLKNLKACACHCSVDVICCVFHVQVLFLKVLELWRYCRDCGWAWRCSQVLCIIVINVSSMCNDDVADVIGQELCRMSCANWLLWLHSLYGLAKLRMIVITQPSHALSRVCLLKWMCIINLPMVCLNVLQTQLTTVMTVVTLWGWGVKVSADVISFTFKW